VSANKKPVEIKHLWTGKVLYFCEVEETAEHPLREAVVVAVGAGANLNRANLNGANLARANLARANLAGAASLPAPAMILAGYWGEVPDDLCIDLMRWDAANHPNPAAFDAWAKGGACPYEGIPYARASHFKEKRSLWSAGEAPRPYDLMVRLLSWTAKRAAQGSGQ
jgi:hypothetical protein